jgi:methylated-DNA-[protein]-cysteine S-methyltransferase
MPSNTLCDIHTITTPIGTLVATADENAIISLDFTDEAHTSIPTDNPLLLRLEKELHEYFEGKRRTFTLPLSPKGTTFQQSVWATLCTIPYGETVSYAEEAKLLGNPKAVRAVANANGRNPIIILIPCHRVIATTGGIGGYSGGIERKEFLLKLEKKKIAQD